MGSDRDDSGVPRRCPLSLTMIRIVIALPLALVVSLVFIASA
jgi:hypothetical protein